MLGGFSGSGPGSGILGGLGWLPEKHTDYIAAVLAEDLGVLGLGITVSLFLLILWRGISLARSLKNPSHSLAVFGLVMLILSQATIHLLVVLNIMPAKGTSLPFMSYGGSSMISFFIAVGLIQYFHRFSERVDEE